MVSKTPLFSNGIINPQLPYSTPFENYKLQITNYIKPHAGCGERGVLIVYYNI